MLDATPPPFSIELAALASRREYLNLEKWLGEQLAAKGPAFAQATLAFLGSKLRDEPAVRAGEGAAGCMFMGPAAAAALCPAHVGPRSCRSDTLARWCRSCPLTQGAWLTHHLLCLPRSPPQGAPPRVNISLETLAIFLRVLGAAGALLPPELAQHLKLVQTAALQQHPQLASVVGEVGPPEAFAADIENEANAYFQRAYAGGGGRAGSVDGLG